MTIHHPVGLQSRFNTHRIIDARGQLIARTEMGPATAVEIRDALNRFLSEPTPTAHRLAQLEAEVKTLKKTVSEVLDLSNDAGAQLFDLVERGDVNNAVRDAKEACTHLRLIVKLLRPLVSSEAKGGAV